MGRKEAVPSVKGRGTHEENIGLVPNWIYVVAAEKGVALGDKGGLVSVPVWRGVAHMHRGEKGKASRGLVSAYTYRGASE